MSARLSRFRRSTAAAAAVAVALSLAPLTSATAADAPDLADRIASVEPGSAKDGAAAKKSAPQGKKAATRGPAATSDHANGAINRSARIADVNTNQWPNDGTVVRTDVVQDLAAQRLRATVTLKPSAADRFIIAYFGEFSGATCHPRAAIAGGVTTADSAGQFLPGSTNTFAVSRSRSGSTLTLQSAAHSAFRTAEYDCSYVVVADRSSGDPAQLFYAERLTTRWQPAFTIRGGEPLQAARKGKWVSMRLEVRNTSRSAARNVTIRAAGKGLKIKPKSRNLGTIGDRTTKYGVTFKVRVAKKNKSRKLTFTVRGTGARTATKKFTIGVAPKPTKYKSLSGRYFWGFASSSATDTKGWDTQVIWFLNKKWAHFGAPKNGAVPKCRKVTKACKKYTYNRKKGIVRIAGKKAKINSYGFRYQAKKDKRRFYEPVTFPKKGKRFGTDLINQDWRGNCLLTCTAITTNLTLDKAGRFVRGSWSVGSWPGLGSSWATIPPDRRGTYRVIGKGRLELRFADGKRERTRIALLHNALNKPSATSGIVLGTKNFYFQD